MANKIKPENIDSAMSTDQEVDTKVSVVQDEVDAEEIARANADQSHQEQITDNADAISAEVTNRSNADSSLQSQITTNANNISSEITNRQNADSTLQSNIDSNTSAIVSEITNRQNADTELQNILDNHAAKHQPNGTDPIPTAIAVNIGDSNAVGSSNSLSRADHVHAHGSQTNPNHHAVASTSDNGFMSSVDKTKLDGIANGATANDTDANLRARSSHTGTQPASTISDFNSVTDSRIAASRDIANGGASLGADSKLRVDQIPPALLGAANYQGTWNATTNSPSIVSSTGTKGHYYVVATAGGSTIDTESDWKIGDWIIFNGSIWQKVDNTDAVITVNGFIGAVILKTLHIAEDTNLYFTTARVLATALGGLSLLTGTAISASDTVLSAMGKLQKQITDLAASKYDASNPNGYETPSQLNTRDTNNRARANHTGSQTSSTISDFASTVLSTVLSGFSLASATAVISSDSILVAIGKIQAQFNAAVALVTPSSTSTANAAGISGSLARADHVHNTVLTRFKLRATALFSSGSTSYVIITGFTFTPNVAGTYLVKYVMESANSSNNAVVTAAIHRANVIVSDSEMSFEATSNRNQILYGEAEVILNGITDFVDVRIKSSNGTGTVTARLLTLLRVA